MRLGEALSLDRDDLDSRHGDAHLYRCRQLYRYPDRTGSRRRELAGDAQDLQTAVACLADPDPRVRAAAITSWIAIYREPFLSHLRGMLHSPEVAERAAGLYALISLDGESTWLEGLLLCAFYLILAVGTFFTPA